MGQAVSHGTSVESWHVHFSVVYPQVTTSTPLLLSSAGLARTPHFQTYAETIVAMSDDCKEKEPGPTSCLSKALCT